MAIEYVEVSEGSGKKVACDYDGTNYHQLVKMEFGADGTATMVSATNPLPISIQDGTSAITLWTAGADAVTNTMNTIPVSCKLMTYNGSSWDRVRSATVAATSTLTGILNNLPLVRYNSSAPSLTNGQVVVMQCDAAGNTFVNLATAIPAGTNNIGDVDVLTLPALPSGTNTIGSVTLKPLTSGGLSVARDIDLDEASPANIKASAGQVYGWYFYNNSAGTIYVKLYDSASAPVLASDTPKLTIPIPAGSAANLAIPTGLAFSNGIGWAATTGVADTNTGAPAANDLIGNLFYN